MSLVQRTFKNFSYLLVARLAFRFLTAAALIYAARYLGDERYGMYTTAAAWANAFLALNDIGMSTVMLRVAARTPEKMAVYFGNTLLVELILSILIWGCIIGIGILLYDTAIVILIAILGASNLIYEFRKVMRGVFRAHLNLKPIALTEIFNGLLFFVAVVAIMSLVKNPETGLFGIAHASLWADAISIIVLLVITLRVVRPHVDLSQLWNMAKEGIPFTVYNLFYMIYFQIGQIVISIMLGSVAVGVYSAPAQLANILLFIPIMVFQVTTPIMYRYSRDDMGKYKKANRLMWRYLSAFGIPAGIGLSFLGAEIIQLVYGNRFFERPEGFHQAVQVMQLFGWFIAIRFLGIAFGNSLTTTDRQGLRGILQMGSVLLNIILDIVLVHRYGIRGAAIATVITESGIAATSIFLTLKYLNESFFRNFLSFIPIAAASVGMIAVLALIKDRLHVIVVVIFGLTAYACFLWVFRFLHNDDKEILSKILKRNAHV